MLEKDGHLLNVTARIQLACEVPMKWLASSQFALRPEETWDTAAEKRTAIPRLPVQESRTGLD